MNNTKDLSALSHEDFIAYMDVYLAQSKIDLQNHINRKVGLTTMRKALTKKRLKFRLSRMQAKLRTINACKGYTNNVSIKSSSDDMISMLCLTLSSQLHPIQSIEIKATA